jgi:hypothetical protein
VLSEEESDLRNERRYRNRIRTVKEGSKVDAKNVEAE